MKRKQIKYSYALFKILCHITEKTHHITIHNFEKDNITIYNTITRTIQALDYEQLIKEYFKSNTYKNLKLTINEYAQFITSLPNNYKDIFEYGVKEEIEKCLKEKQKA